MYPGVGASPGFRPEPETMTTLDEKAQPTPEVRRPSEAPDWYRLESMELVDADSISPEGEFPKYGEFIDVRLVDTGGVHDSDGPTYVECPGGLARALVEAGVEAGDFFAIEDASKNGDDEWTFTVDAELDPSDYEP